MEPRLPRRLVAILYADVANYSRLTGDDEDATHRRLRDYLEFIATTIQNHQGKVMHFAGDAVLARFDAVLDAMTSAIDIQQALEARNADLPESRQLKFRIGINLGDVIEDRDDIYGDGVNIAARLESLAEPGGICISESVKTALGNKLPQPFHSMGAQRVKNISDPVQAYSVDLGGGPPAAANPGLPDHPAVPGKPSIAVLAFDNMSDDPEQEYFSDGITEDIITELSRFSGLFVIARNSSFAYKGKAVDIRTVAQELGVRYLLEGSVRRSGKRLRINAQLLDTEQGSHIWAERYDGNLDDVFTLQDELTQKIVGSIAPQIEIAEIERSRSSPSANLSSYELALRAQAVFHDSARNGSPTLREESVRICEAALELDPDNTHALWLLGYNHTMQYLYRWGEDPQADIDAAWKLADRSLQVDPSNPKAYTLRAMVNTFRHDFDNAIADFNRAYQLNPNFAMNAMFMAWGESLAGLTREAKQHAELALRLSPRDLDLWLGDAYLALLQASFSEGDFEEAKRWGLLAIQMTPKAPIRRALMIATCMHLDDADGAIRHARELEQFAPGFIPSILDGSMTLYRFPEHNALLIDGLRKAGFG